MLNYGIFFLALVFLLGFFKLTDLSFITIFKGEFVINVFRNLLIVLISNGFYIFLLDYHHLREKTVIDFQYFTDRPDEIAHIFVSL